MKIGANLMTLTRKVIQKIKTGSKGEKRIYMLVKTLFNDKGDHNLEKNKLKKHL